MIVMFDYGCQPGEKRERNLEQVNKNSATEDGLFLPKFFEIDPKYKFSISWNVMAMRERSTT